MSGAVVRRAAAADLPAIGRLGALLIEEHHAFDSRRFLAARPRTAVDYASFLRSQLEEADVLILVADEGGRVLGYSYAAVEGYDWMALRGPAAVVHDLVVDPEHRRRGLGRRLLEATLQDLASRRAPRAVLSTAVQNEPAQRLFASVGFRPTMLEMTRELDARAERK
jgi:ribosomal protein S18 acetylase RimI-like enzyme